MIFVIMNKLASIGISTSIFLTIFRVGLKYLHHISNKIWQLLIQLHLFHILPYAFSLPVALMLNPLNITLHDPYIIIEQTHTLTELGRAHGQNLII